MYCSSSGGNAPEPVPLSDTPPSIPLETIFEKTILSLLLFSFALLFLLGGLGCVALTEPLDWEDSPSQ